jgi:1-aminocyclopropane-1-carboxylate deaminase/D-cysteine desulfhydrase-like pyridoxal-dependent ACC family enzyme
LTQGGNHHQASGRAEQLATRFAMLPRVELGVFPTPLQRMPALGRTVGHPRLYIKRDDLSGLGLGGNKVRALEFMLGRALADGCDTVICGGGLQSNMCRLTAAAAAKLGLRCLLVHNDVRPEAYQGNQLLNHLFGAEPLYAGRISEDERNELCERLAEAQANLGRRPYVAANGGSIPVGALGFAAGALEFWRQDALTGAGVRDIVIVGAMGGTAAGLIAGVGLLGAPYHVHVISVEYDLAELRSRLEPLVSGAIRLLNDAAPQGPALGVPPLDSYVTLYDGYLGPGYAIPTGESRQALMDAARLEAVLCEPIYTAKTLAGCLDLIRQGRIAADGACCFWHTGGTAALFGLAAEVYPGQ